MATLPNSCPLQWLLTIAKCISFFCSPAGTERCLMQRTTSLFSHRATFCPSDILLEKRTLFKGICSIRMFLKENIPSVNFTYMFYLLFSCCSNSLYKLSIPWHF